MLEKLLVKAYNLVESWVIQNRYFFPFIAIVIPLLVRAIPEILMGPYIVGFDTIGFYVPNALLWLHTGINLVSFFETAPLFYAIFTSIVAIVGSPVFVLKIISPLLLSLLGLSIFAYAKRGLDWSPSKSAFVALLGTLYFVALRASWDQLREELGLVFFFITLMLLSKRTNMKWKNYVVLSLAMVTVALSHQLVSVLMFGVIAFTVAYSLFHKASIDSIKLIAVSSPAASYFFIFYFSGVMQSGLLNYSTNVGSPLASWTGFASYQSMLINTGGLFLYCFLLMLPLALMGIWRFRNLQLHSWLLFSIILMLLPIASVSPYRWVLMLTYPLAFFSTDALSRLRSIKWKFHKVNVRRIAMLYLVLSTTVLSFGYIFMTTQQPFAYFNPSYFNGYSFQIPTSMLQNTISATDCKDATNAIQWFKNNENGSALLLTHTVFYGWALLSLSENRVRNYGFDFPSHAAMIASQEGNQQLFVLWWVNGHGWYNQPTLPPSFKEVYYSGQIAIYEYSLAQ
jgi:hypothetical protein